MQYTNDRTKVQHILWQFVNQPLELMLTPHVAVAIAVWWWMRCMSKYLQRSKHLPWILISSCWRDTVWPTHVSPCPRAHTAAKCRDKNKWTAFYFELFEIIFLWALCISRSWDGVRRHQENEKKKKLFSLGRRLLRMIKQRPNLVGRHFLSHFCSFLFMSMDEYAKGYHRAAGMQQRNF